MNAPTSALATASPVSRRLALLVAATALAACGGGGGGGTSTTAAGPAPAPSPSPSPSPSPTPPAPPPAATGSSFYVAGLSSRADAGSSVLVADAELGGLPLLALQVDSATALTLVPAFSADAAARTLTYRGSAGAYFVRQGQLMQIDLAQPGTPAAVRISSLANACGVQQVAPLQANGRNAWIIVTHAGADGDCGTPADNGQAVVRSGTAADVPPAVLPAGVTMQATYLLDDDGALLWMLAADNSGTTPRLVAYGPALQRVDVAGGNGIGSLASARFGSNAFEGAYVRTGGLLLRIDATASAVTISAPLHSFTGASGQAAYDKPTLYFNDGAALYALNAAGSARLLMPAAPGYPLSQLLAQSPDVLIVQQQDLQGRGPVLALNKRSGVATQLLAAPAAGEQRAVWASQGDTVYYATATNGRTGELRSVRTDGTGDTRVYTGVQVVGGVTTALSTALRTKLALEHTALLLCQPLSSQADCRGSSLLQFDLASRGITVLGPFDGSSAAAWQVVSAVAVEGVRGAVVEVRSGALVADRAHSDFYTFIPGLAGSLKLVRQPAL